MSREALASFDEPEKASPFSDEAAVLGVDFRARLADGRASARRDLQQSPVSYRRSHAGKKGRM